MLRYLRHTCKLLIIFLVIISLLFKNNINIFWWNYLNSSICKWSLLKKTTSFMSLHGTTARKSISTSKHYLQLSHHISSNIRDCFCSFSKARLCSDWMSLVRLWLCINSCRFSLDGCLYWSRPWLQTDHNWNKHTGILNRCVLLMRDSANWINFDTFQLTNDVCYGSIRLFIIVSPNVC